MKYISNDGNFVSENVDEVTKYENELKEKTAEQEKKIAEKKTPAGKLRDLSVAEIKTKIAELKQELFNLRFQAEVGKLENTAQLKKVKKEIARCYTVLTERENTK